MKKMNVDKIFLFFILFSIIIQVFSIYLTLMILRIPNIIIG